MASWLTWYAKYTSKTIFRGGKVWKSPECAKMGQMDNIHWVTSVNRAVFPRDKCVVNKSMERCWKENGWELPTKYLPSVANIPAGYQSFKKYDKDPPSPDEVAWNLSYLWLERHFRPHMGGSEVLPLEFVIKEMDMNTSPGYPWSLSYSDKKTFLTDVHMRKVLWDYEECIQQEFPCGVEPIWTCSVKAKELRTQEKIAANKLRTFTASPFEHSAALNKYCLHMNNCFYKTNNRHWSFVGASKYDGNWNILAKKLLQFPNIYSLDGKTFDCSLFARAMWDQCDLRFSFLAPQHRTPATWNAMRNLYATIIYAVCVLDLGDLMRKLTGNPSGSSNTIVDNTMILVRFMFYAWIVLSEKFRSNYRAMVARANGSLLAADHYSGPVVDDYGYEFLMKHVFMRGNGDDDIFSVSDAVNSWFNPRAIAEVWASIGLESTAESWDPEELTKIWYLSHSFVMISGLWLPSPETEKVLCSLHVGSNTDDIRWHLLRALALRIESWANLECRLKIETYINYVMNKHAHELYGSVNDTHISAILSTWKSDKEIWRLYTGLEAAQSA